jgi:NADH-quinone oxidoreductase subunit L
MLFGLPEYLILVIPLAGSLLVPVVGRYSARARDWTPAVLMGISMLLCWSLIPDIGSAPKTWSWINIPGFVIPFSMLLDSLSVIMAILASTLCFLIYVYSTEYMAHEGDRNRFFFLMLLFGGGMLTLVLSNNLLIAFIGWEIMGTCSYGLIGFWNDRRNPPEADPTGYDSSNPLLQFKTEGEYNTHCGTKAFIVTRIGDALMLAGILLLFTFTGSFLFQDTSIGTQAVQGIAEHGGWITALAGVGLLLPTLLLIFAGAIGKSGQFPLQVWLPEAMSGPTAVSALIHAATMVKAGVYISARFLLTIVSATEASGHSVSSIGMIPLQIGVPDAFTFFAIVALIGALTAFITGTMGMVSNELKQVLAFSTLSQLGYMVLAIGTAGMLAHYDEAYLSSVLHVISHGAFKALLFLAAGGIIHAVHTKYMSKMGGLRKYMPKTFAIMWIGVLALSGIPPFSGFWSKDSIIEYVYGLGIDTPIGIFLFTLAVAAAACTIFYSIRLMGMVFYGPSEFDKHDHEGESVHGHDDEEKESEESHDEHHKVPSDPGPAMMIPLYILGAFTIIAFMIYPTVQNIVLQTNRNWLEILIDDMIAVKFGPEGIVPFVITLGALALGGVPAYWMYIKNAGSPSGTIPELGVRRRLYSFLKHRWYVNESYYWFVNKFLRFAELWRVRVDDHIIDGIDFKSAGTAQTLSRKIRWFDDNVVDGFAEGISTRSVEASEIGLESQTGRINDYVGVVIFGIGLLIIIGLLIVGVL